MNKDNIFKINRKSDHNYKVRDKVILNNRDAYKYET